MRRYIETCTSKNCRHFGRQHRPVKRQQRINYRISIEWGTAAIAAQPVLPSAPLIMVAGSPCLLVRPSSHAARLGRSNVYL